jgi:hypothetical protein
MITNAIAVESFVEGLALVLGSIMVSSKGAKQPRAGGLG